ncbi:hypothetical protein FWK35_00013618 [Aphis craccivora]|uniref:Uncharacterized protein n=1 Tax=Aphis craccivora TaxID=307492 RepID=A0A6G0YFZ6_APHCR|nr:hypothetical protein FWK35_00013618 [Aphis craccivora]
MHKKVYGGDITPVAMHSNLPPEITLILNNLDILDSERSDKFIDFIMMWFFVFALFAEYCNDMLTNLVLI